MPTWVLRKSVDNERVGVPFPCASPTQVTRVVGLLTLEERMPWLLAAHETAREGAGGQRRIYRGKELVGYIVVLSSE